MSAPDLDLASLHAAYRRGVSPRDVIGSVFDRIDAAGDPGIFISRMDRDDALARADALDRCDPQTKPLWGVPFAVKDNIDIAGMSTTAACPDYAYEPAEDATVVARLCAAGAIPVGKTNLDQFATGLVGVRTPWPVPLNACDPALVPGGSSSGSAVAVARGLVTFALGTDTAGSGRIPAMLNNIVGLKPSLGGLSTAGVVPACRTLDCVSVFAGTVEDAWAATAAAWGPDAGDPYSRAVPLAGPALPPSLRIGVPDPAGRIFGDAAAAAAFDAALALAAPFGPAAEIDMAPLFEVAALLYEGAWVAERYQAIRAFIEARPDSLHPVTRTIIEGARRLSAADAFAGAYRLAELGRRAEALWRDVDVLIVPSAPWPCTLADVEADPIGANSRLGTYTNFVNLLNLCALAVPGPFRSDGLPAGVTLIAPAGQDGLLAALGARLHRAAGVPLGATGRALPPAPEPPPGPPPGAIELVVVGAHMSGMALNRELLDRGGSFVRAARTRPCYRLHALPGAPARPGLIRAEDGATIEAEVWALPPAGFADLVAGIPAPLGIGTVLLADGTAPKGYLCEADAVRTAPDISRFGGWRAYCAAAQPASG